MRSLPIVSALLLAASPAFAEPKSKSPLPPADPYHDFHTVDRLTPVTTFGVALGIELWDSDALQPIDSVVGFDVGGHFVSESGAGGYVVVPVSMVSTNDTLLTDEDTETMLGNLEVGGMYARPINRRADLVAHLGVALPTADDDSPLSFLQPLASTPRYGDLAQRWPNSTWLRLGVSPMGTAGPVFWRADLGLDLMIDDDDETAADNSPILRINVAGGVDFGKVDASVELATNIADEDDPDDDGTASTLALGARFDGGNLFPGLALIFPIGFDNQIDDFLDLAIALSLTARLP